VYGGSSLLVNEGLLALLAPILALILVWRMRRRGATWARVILALLLLAWLLTLAALVFFPLPLPPFADRGPYDAGIDGWPAPWASVIPLSTISASVGVGFEWPAARYLLGNAIAFAPLGFLAPLLWARWDGPLRTLALGLLVSGGIELAQLSASLALGFPYRVADVDDVLLNTVGTVVGFASLGFVRRAVLGGDAAAADAPHSPR